MSGTGSTLSTKTGLSEAELVDKVKGVIYGTAIGDGIGLATEFMHVKEAKLLYGNGPIKFGNSDGHPFWRDGFRSRWFENDFTDDTDQMLLLAQCLLADDGVLNPVHFAYRISEWCKIGFPELDNKLPRGIGYTVGSTCGHKDHSTDPLRAAYQVWDKNDRNLAANGAVMRTGVLGIPFFWEEKKVAENSMMAAKVTHADPRSVTSAVIASVIISRLLCGQVENSPKDKTMKGSEYKAYFTNVIQNGSTEDYSYLQKYKKYPAPTPKSLNNPIQKTLMGQVRKLTSYVTGKPQNPLAEIEANFSIPSHAPTDNKRLETPAPIRPDVKSIDDFGSDETMSRLCRDVVDQYKFLLENNPLCPLENRSSHADETETTKDATTTTRLSWTEELYAHTFPESISSLKLNERDKIGYTFKCLGAGLYLATRKKPDEMTSAEFFETLITQLLLEAGDADTNCAVAGAILGCRLGKSGLPRDWVEGVRHKEFLENISNNLCKMLLKNIE